MQIGLRVVDRGVGEVDAAAELHRDGLAAVGSAVNSGGTASHLGFALEGPQAPVVEHQGVAVVTGNAQGAVAVGHVGHGGSIEHHGAGAAVTQVDHFNVVNAHTAVGACEVAAVAAHEDAVKAVTAVNDDVRLRAGVADVADVAAVDKAGDHVPHQHIVAIVAIHIIGFDATVDSVFAVTTHERVAAGATEQQVVARAAVHGVVATVATQAVGGVVAKQNVVAVAARQGVAGGGAGEGVVAAAGHGVGGDDFEARAHDHAERRVATAGGVGAAPGAGAGVVAPRSEVGELRFVIHTAQERERIGACHAVDRGLVEHHDLRCFSAHADGVDAVDVGHGPGGREVDLFVVDDQGVGA